MSGNTEKPLKSTTTSLGISIVSLEKNPRRLRWPISGYIFLIVVDARSKWPEVVPMRKQPPIKPSTYYVECSLGWGIPHHLVSDNGPQFTSEQFEMFMKDNNVKHLRGAPYPHKHNWISRKVCAEFKNAMKAAKTKDDLSLRIARFLPRLQKCSHAVTGEATSRLDVGKETSIKVRNDKTRS